MQAFGAMITRVRRRLQIGRAIVAVDRGRISAASDRLLTDSVKAPFDFILW